MKREPIEVYRVKADGTRNLKDLVCTLDADGELPSVGDTIAVTSDGTGAIFEGGIAVYRVVDREHAFYGKLDGSALPYSKTWIHVRELTHDDYFKGKLG